MISRGRIQKHEEGDPTTFITHDKKKKKVKGGPSNPINPPPRNPNGKELLHIECYNFHKKGHYAQDFLEKNNGPHYNTISNNKRLNDQRRRDDRRNDCNGRDERRIRDAPSDHEED